MNASPPNRRVFLGFPVPKNLDPRRQRLRTGLIERIRKAGYQPEIFLEEGLAAALAWSMENVSHVMQRCVGMAILAMPRWTFAEGDRRLQLASEFHQYEAAIAFSLGLPLLVVVERGVEERGFLWTSCRSDGRRHQLQACSPSARQGQLCRYPPRPSEFVLDSWTSTSRRLPTVKRAREGTPNNHVGKPPFVYGTPIPRSMVHQVLCRLGLWSGFSTGSLAR